MHIGSLQAAADDGVPKVVVVPGAKLAKKKKAEEAPPKRKPIDGARLKKAKEQVALALHKPAPDPTKDRAFTVDSAHWHVEDADIAIDAYASLAAEVWSKSIQLANRPEMSGTLVLNVSAKPGTAFLLECELLPSPSQPSGMIEHTANSTLPISSDNRFFFGFESTTPPEQGSTSLQIGPPPGGTVFISSCTFHQVP
jgi:hypothetical protein